MHSKFMRTIFIFSFIFPFRIDANVIFYDDTSLTQNFPLTRDCNDIFMYVNLHSNKNCSRYI